MQKPSLALLISKFPQCDTGHLPLGIGENSRMQASASIVCIPDKAKPQKLGLRNWIVSYRTPEITKYYPYFWATGPAKSPLLLWQTDKTEHRERSNFSDRNPKQTHMSDMQDCSDPARAFPCNNTVISSRHFPHFPPTPGNRQLLFSIPNKQVLIPKRWHSLLAAEFKKKNATTVRHSDLPHTFA